MNITTIEGLLEQGSEKKGRQAIVDETGLSMKQVLTLVNMADLFRVKGVGSQYAELLQAVGVNTVVELSQRNSDNLHAAMIEHNDEKNLVRQPPSAETVATWVAAAKELPRMVHY